MIFIRHLFKDFIKFNLVFLDLFSLLLYFNSTHQNNQPKNSVTQSKRIQWSRHKNPSRPNHLGWRTSGNVNICYAFVLVLYHTPFVSRTSRNFDIVRALDYGLSSVTTCSFISSLDCSYSTPVKKQMTSPSSTPAKGQTTINKIFSSPKKETSEQSLPIKQYKRSIGNESLSSPSKKVNVIKVWTRIEWCLEPFLKFTSSHRSI